MQSGLSPFLVNILPLQNIVTNASGLDPTTILSNNVAALQTVVNTSNRTVYTDFLSAFTPGGAITLQSPLVLCNGTLVTGGGGTTTTTTTNSTIQGSAGFVTASATVNLGVGTTTILEIGATGDVLVSGASEMRVSSMNFYADYIGASTINVGGTCFAQNFVTLSDSGVKSQISTLTDVRGFDGIGTYRFRVGESVQEEIGLLAQEVEAVYPECVMEGVEGVKYIKYNALVALLVGTVRRLEERVRVLEGSN
jgi:hypothetical protein